MNYHFFIFCRAELSLYLLFSGWEQYEGILSTPELRREDAGTYTCIAENNAGRVEASAQLGVIIKPQIEEFSNKTFPAGKSEARLTCRASGDPLPKIIWRKLSRV